jgi:hypothetical protein
MAQFLYLASGAKKNCSDIEIKYRSSTQNKYRQGWDSQKRNVHQLDVKIWRGLEACPLFLDLLKCGYCSDTFIGT